MSCLLERRVLIVTAGVKMYVNCRFENAGKIGADILLAG
jgi:hypothetical protein